MTRFRIARKNRRVVLIAMALFLSGCAEEKSPRVPVTGLVTMDDKPVAEVIVTFTPTGETLGNGALGATDTRGRFSLSDVRGGDGALPGDYKVSLYPTPSSDSAGLPTDVVSSGAIGLPSMVLDPNNTPLRATVPADGADVEVALNSNGDAATVEVKPSAQRQ